jgi:hypothetical protein
LSNDITVVVTSCGRYDLLSRTLTSFRKFNSDTNVSRIIVVEDGDGNPSAICDQFDATLIRTGARSGQIAAIDLAYSKVETPYIFHLEDDWEFYRSGFIEKSHKILDADPSTLCVWLRAWNDTNGHPLSFRSPGGAFGVLSVGFHDLWHGFTFNPGLRRLADYKRIGCFADHVNPTHGGQVGEHSIGGVYYGMGYRAVILEETGYVRHIGLERRVTS